MQSEAAMTVPCFQLQAMQAWSAKVAGLLPCAGQQQTIGSKKVSSTGLTCGFGGHPHACTGIPTRILASS